MKTELTDVSETRKTLTFEIPQDVVDAEINRIAKTYSQKARIPGFRPGKVPATIVKQRFRDQIMHDVMHGLIPRAVDDALQERGIEPVDTPSIKDVALHEGQPMTFTATIDTVPSFDPGDLSTITLRPAVTAVAEEAVDKALDRLRDRAAKYEAVEGRPVADGDTVTADIERRSAAKEAGTEGGAETGEETDRHENVQLEIGAPANPPGFDAELVGLSAGERKTFTITFPEGYPVEEMAGQDVTYDVAIKEIRRKVLPELDDEFARDLGEFESLEQLRERVRGDIEAEAEENGRRQVRNDLLSQLATRVTFPVPDALVEREIDRRLEEFARQLMQQRIDPRQAGIDWAQFREAQREPARASVASALVLDEIARRENLTVTNEDVDKEIEQFAARSGRTPAAVRAQIEKDGGLGRLTGGLRREKAVDLALSRAKMTDV
jgi:trigger factor